MTPDQHPRQSPDAPSSTEERGRGNSGEGKDPGEGLYPPARDNQPGSSAADSTGSKPASGSPTGQGKPAN